MNKKSINRSPLNHSILSTDGLANEFKQILNLDTIFAGVVSASGSALLETTTGLDLLETTTGLALQETA